MSEITATVLIADDDEDILSALKMALMSANYQVVTANSPRNVLSLIERRRFSCVVMDLNYTRDTTSGTEGLELLNAIRAVDQNLPVIAITGYGSIELAVELMKSGANDFIEKPWRNSQLLLRVQQQIERADTLLKSQKLAQENAMLKSRGDTNIIAKSPLMKGVLQQIKQIAVSDMNVLFTGENGTGKSMLASYLHQHSSRRAQSFHAVNMGGITETLFESEMFGHVKGAFTDAKESRIGRFELATNGTLFLDEIANISPKQQAKLLRVLEEKQFEKVGSSVTIESNVRLVSATNANLNHLVEQGDFRQDLLYRLNTIEIRIPALRDRAEDILPLASGFLDHLCQKYHIELKHFGDDAVEAMLHYHWPGNIRELSHTVERALFLSQTQLIGVDALNLPNSESNSVKKESTEATLEQIEKNVIIERLHKYLQDPQKTALSLGLSRSAYYRRLEKYELNNQT